MSAETLCRVMVVDDEFIIRQGIEYLLDWEKEGFQLVAEASDGEEALEKIRELEPDIVLSDIVMPRLDGIELTKRIQEQYPHIKVIILSSYSDFDYVKNTFQSGAVDYILKPTLSPEEILKALRKAAKGMSKQKAKDPLNLNLAHHLSKYLLGYSEVLDNEMMNQQFPSSTYYLFATNKRGQTIESFFQKELYEELKQYHPCSFQGQDGIQICLLNSDEHVEQVEEHLRNVIKKSTLIKEHDFFALSEGFHDIKLLKQYYEKELRYILQMRFYCKADRIMRAKRLPNKYAIEKFDARGFNNKLDAMNLLDALHMVMKYVERAVLGCMDEGELKSTTGSALYNFISIMEERHMNAESIQYLKLNCINLMESAWFQEDYVKQLHHIIEDFKILVESYELDNANDPIRELLHYMEEHFSEPLSLQDLAEHFGFSYNYLSSYFASQSKGTFTEHLNRVRIERACQLLENRQYSIAEIGGMVGYSDHSYFCKVFKKLIGKTPSEYRKR